MQTSLQPLRNYTKLAVPAQRCGGRRVRKQIFAGCRSDLKELGNLRVESTIRRHTPHGAFIVTHATATDA